MQKRSTTTTRELWSCVKVEVAVLGSPSLIIPTVSVDVKQHLKKKAFWFRAQELCENGGYHPGLHVPNGPYGLCGRKAKMNLNNDNMKEAVRRPVF